MAQGVDDDVSYPNAGIHLRLGEHYEPMVKATVTPAPPPSRKRKKTTLPRDELRRRYLDEHHVRRRVAGESGHRYLAIAVPISTYAANVAEGFDTLDEAAAWLPLAWMTSRSAPLRRSPTSICMSATRPGSTRPSRWKGSQERQRDGRQPG